MAAIQQILLVGSRLKIFVQPSQVAQLSAESFTNGSASASVSLVFDNTGLSTLHRVVNGDITDPESSFSTSYRWVEGGSPAAFSIRLLIQGGNISFGSPVNQWLSLQSTQTWTLSASVSSGGTNQIRFVSGTIEIAKTANLSNILASGTFSFVVAASTSGDFIV